MFRVGALLFLFAFGSQALVDRGKVVALNNVNYYVGGTPVSRLDISRTDSFQAAVIPDSDIFPLTVINLGTSTFAGTQFRTHVANFSSSDDVFQPEFLRTIYLQNERNVTSSVDLASCSPLLKQSDNHLLMTAKSITSRLGGVVQTTLTECLPHGPYFVSAKTGDIFKAYRLYHDENLAFIQGTVDDGANGFMSLPAVTEDVIARSIAVPSRLYYTVTDDQPLAGLRFGLKDIYHVKGLRTSAESRSYFYTYGPQNTTAPSVQQLLNQGAVLVGKMGTVQFANAGSPTADWVDLHCPFNPRGDGYQDPSGSSTGPGAGIASYDWLDFSVGSDTGGSMRGPAGSQGVYGNRPSTGAVSMDHVVPLSNALDTAGAFARDADIYARVVQHWYTNTNTDYRDYPKRLEWVPQGSGYFSPSSLSSEASTAIENFLHGLESFLGTNRTIVNVTQQWAETRPSNTTADINELFNTTYAVLTTVDQWNLVGKPLFADYAAVHDGRTPFINPNPLARWQWGQETNSNSSYGAALHNMTMFRDWWQTSGFGAPDNTTCSESIFAYIWDIGVPSYRNRYFISTNSPPLGFDYWAIAGYAGAGEVIVPVGESPYNSTISGKTEYLPVSVALQAARGCDHMLAGLVRDLQASGVLKAVNTGSRLWS
ncbi:amidase signature enzyme [Aureobasidium pullulans]|nr:amidase signature enzyme [Aureobasidium pullulans]